MRSLPPPLLALSPGALLPLEVSAFLTRLADAVAGGLRGLLLREERLEDGVFLELALRARELMPHGWLAIHDRIHVARSLACEGAHVGFRSLPASVARAQLGAAHALGYSAHAHDVERVPEEADYCFLGPVLATESKRGLLEPLGHGRFAALLEEARCPVWGIGGLDPEAAARVLASGAAGAAVRGGLLGAPDPGRACERYRRALAPYCTAEEA